MNLDYQKYQSPVGALTLIADQENLIAILWPEDGPHRVKIGRSKLNPHSKILGQTSKQLEEYFGQKRKVFDLPISFQGTDFQNQVWKELMQIPFGSTVSYLEMAKRVGSPKAMRAVGGASGKNPLSIVVPCHRVIGVSGKLTGFAGGIAAKKYLLEFEAKSR